MFLFLYSLDNTFVFVKVHHPIARRILRYQKFVRTDVYLQVLPVTAIQVSVGGKKKHVTVKLSENCTSTESEPSGGMTFFIRPRGENAKEAFDLIRGHCVGSSTIVVKPDGHGLLCKAKAHPHFNPKSKTH